jgi:hypothetical protein
VRWSCSLPRRGTQPDPRCDAIYADYILSERGLSAFKDTESHTCWKRGIEEHPTYDLLVVELTDQGWIKVRPTQDVDYGDLRRLG